MPKIPPIREIIAPKLRPVNMPMAEITVITIKFLLVGSFLSFITKINKIITKIKLIIVEINIKGNNIEKIWIRKNVKNFPNTDEINDLNMKNSITLINKKAAPTINPIKQSK